MDLSALHQYLITKDEVNKFLLLLEQINSELFKENFNLDQFLSEQTSYELSQNIKNSLTINKVNISDKTALQSFFTRAHEQIEALPVIHIILAFYPKDKMIKSIHEWFYQNFKKTVLLDVSVDENLIGGGVISFRGRANDYSLKNQLEQLS